MYVPPGGLVVKLALGGFSYDSIKQKCQDMIL